MPYRRNTVTARCRRDPAGAGGTAAPGTAGASGLQSDVVVRIIDLRGLPESAAKTVVDRTSKLFAELDECNIALTASSPKALGSPSRKRASEQSDFVALFSTPHMTVAESVVPGRLSNKLIKLSSAYVQLGNSLAFVTDIVKPPAPNAPREAPGHFAQRVEKSVAVIIAQVLKALSRAHSRGLVIGNLTAANVFVTKYVRLGQNEVWPCRVRIHDAGVYRCTTVVDDADTMAPDVTPYALWGALPPNLARDVSPWAATSVTATELVNAHALAVDMASDIVDAACTDTVVRLLGAPPPPVEAVYLQPCCDSLVSMMDARADIWAVGQLVVELLTDVPVPPFTQVTEGGATQLGGRVLLFPRNGGPAWSIAARSFVSKACHPTNPMTADELLEEPFIARNVDLYDQAMALYAARVAERPQPALGESARTFLPDALDSSVGPSFDHRVPLMRLEEAQEAKLAAAEAIEQRRKDEAALSAIVGGRQPSLFASELGSQSSAPSVTDDGTVGKDDDRDAAAASAASAALLKATIDIREGIDAITLRLRSAPGTSQLRVVTADRRRVVFLGSNADVGQVANGRAAAALDRLSAVMLRADAAMPGFNRTWLRSLVSRTLHCSAQGISQPPPPARQQSLPEDNPNVVIHRLQTLLTPMGGRTQGAGPIASMASGSPAVAPTTPAGSMASPIPWEDVAERSRGDTLGGRHLSTADVAALASNSASDPHAASTQAPRITAKASDMCNFLYAKWVTSAASREADQALAAAEDDVASAIALVGPTTSSSTFLDDTQHGLGTQQYLSPMRHNLSIYAQSSTGGARFGGAGPTAGGGGNGQALYVSHQRAGSLHRVNSDSSLLSSP